VAHIYAAPGQRRPECDEPRDADGKSLIQDIVNVAREKGEGWTEYRWINPVSNKVEPKLTYVKRIADKDIAASIGIYK
jgi:signal transduction histidine kinase